MMISLKKTQLNVLHVIDHSGLGGAQTLLFKLLNKWNDRSVKLLGFCLRHKSIEVKGKQIFFSKSKSKYSFVPLFSLNNFVKNNNIDILHLHLEKSIMLGVLLKIFLNKKIKIIVHEHGGIFKNNLCYNWFLKVFKNKIDLFIAISRATKRELVDKAKIPEEKVRVLYNFVDFSSLSYEKLGRRERKLIRADLGFDRDDFVVGFAGRLTKRKGWIDFLTAAKILNNLNYRFLMVGDGMDRQKLLDHIRKNKLDHKVVYLGYIDIDDIRDFYKVIDCFVIPSHWEPMGITELEAQFFGVPVIASNVTGLNEVVENNENGLLFKPRNPDDLAEKIKLIHKDEALKRKIVKGGYLNVKRFSIKKYIQKLREIYMGVRDE